MAISKKRVVPIFLIVSLFLIQFVSSATGQVVTVPQEQKKGWFETYFWFVYTPVFWYIVIGLILFMVLLIVVFFVIRWLIKFIKSRNNIFWRLKSERIKLSKMQRSYPSKHWWKIDKNVPIRLVRYINGKPAVSRAIAFHRGDYTTHEGNIVIAMNLIGKNKFLIFPETDMLVIPDKESYEISAKNEKTKKIDRVTISNLPRAKDIIQFNENEILLYADSISNTGMFFVPVLVAKDKKIIDLSMPIYQSLREVVISEFLYSQTSEFVDVAKKSINLNPNLSYSIKEKDSSGSVEVPKGAS